MTKKVKAQNQSEISKQNSSADTVLGFVILGLLTAGTVGVLKAFSMTGGLDVLLCLLGSVVAFGAVYFIYFGKH
ncbi:MAG TPA: hypothetical protein VFM25_07830 [Verrucomicrobiae bacterium]|nr:hypothetical protein [Verrucomicrobiae bacterium]